MPVCSVFLLSLKTSIPTFLAAVQATSPRLDPLVTAKVIRWIITPTSLSKESLLSPSSPWHVLVILPGALTTLPEHLQPLIENQWSIEAGIPSKLISTFSSTNHNLLHPSPVDVPPLTGSMVDSKTAPSAQSLELSGELRDWISGGKGPKGAVSMLNLLAFNPGLKDQYLEYGKAFAKSIGSKRGGVAKIVGKVLPESCDDGWDETLSFSASMFLQGEARIYRWAWLELTRSQMALAHYPSLEHFADMLAGEDYQAVNKRFRVGSLRDTCILCTSEVEVEVSGGVKANL
ncbi:MAG: hypothetical protein LQ350_007671 [Teloschistes chrysophthalmus]|nr:MAG: hypothetical protein LQ350_007671 [Niorma chrysophthalma]